MKLTRSKQLVLAGAALLFSVTGQAASQEILNTSYDVSRELFAEINPKFQEFWKKESGNDVNVKQSHAGSSTQARAILQGLKADVVTFNQVTDIDILAEKGNFVAKDWNKKFPNNASPFYSTTAFLVRKGNPKNIKNWDDLARADVKLVFPNPKTSGNARYTYLASWIYANKEFAGDQDKIKDFVSKFLGNVVVFDTGGRGATTSFVERQLGDVLLTFESEVNLIRKEYGADKYDIIIPPISILAEFPVAVVERVAKSKGTLDVATAYLNYLYQPEAQRILASSFYRVHDSAVKTEFAAQFPELELVAIESIFGSWAQIDKDHFANGAILDDLLKKAHKN
ncbi:thiosulfate ABC transporter substrate-binding protein CysP [Cellvibrio polysaccharolyticus]|uniref:Sulfate ABC transporter substrate-binding protein n=1 Tax=Cellvibrio polysaccharolyticus TaxID=2082724 RepID=A0A928YTN6_9GAMM|nr:thiosulfate ABC transporter substrate-binding protein CysP [Cellvibrio polysaccharolyticus]MBE8716565.1 sulfate ABC transporter substrate-binding protein [Cellvibrio polysaccharolyticus]